jgi:hypothetical protein
MCARSSASTSFSITERRNSAETNYRPLIDDAGAPIGVQMKLMRHSNIGTTGKYGDACAEAKLRTNRKVAGRLLPATFRPARRQAIR